MTHRPHRDDSWSVRDRRYREVQESAGRSGRIALAAGVVCVGTLLLVASFSLYQVSDERRASRLIEHGIASVTDIDSYLEETAPALRETAGESGDELITLPEFPIDVPLSAGEVRESNDAELRAIVLRRASSQVYDQGLAAFASEGGQSLGAITAENAVDTFLGFLRGSTHTRAGVATIIFAALVALCAVIVAASDFRPGVLRTIGGAMLGGALTGLALSSLMVFLMNRTGGSDPFTSDIAGIAQAVFEVPQRNFLIASLFSGILFGAGWALAILERRARAETASDWGGERVVYDEIEVDEIGAGYDDVIGDRGPARAPWE